MIEEDIKSFIKYIEKERLYSPHTVRSYKKDLEDYGKFLLNKQIYEFADTNHFVIREYLAELKQSLSRSSMNRKLSTLKSFYGFLKKRGLTSTDPTIKVSSGAVMFKYPNVLKINEVIMLLDYDYGQQKLDLRDKSLIEFLYSSGCRVGEACALNLKNLDLLGGTAKVLGKGNRERVVPLGNIAVHCLYKYLKVREELGWGQNEDAVFITVTGNRLSSRSVRRIVRKYAMIAGISKNVSPHTLRHSFATHMLERGCNLRSVQDMLGHKKLQTTQRYTQITKRRMKEVYLKFHPRSK